MGSNLAKGKLFTATSFFGDVSVAQLVASASGVVLGGVAEVVGSNLARGRLFTATSFFGMSQWCSW